MERETGRAQYAARANVKNLLRCLYFKLAHCSGLRGYTDIIFAAEEKFNRFLQTDKDLIED